MADASLSGTVRSGDERVMVVIEVDEQVLADRHGEAPYERSTQQEDSGPTEQAGGQTGQSGDNDSAGTDAVRPDAVDGDAVALRGLCVIRDGPTIGAETAPRLACDSTEIRLIHGQDGTVVSESPLTKTIPRRVRRAMRRRDKDRCVFPGCDTHGWVEAHQLIHRADGGSHELENLATLCKRHHHLVHEGGFSIKTHDDGKTFDFYRPDGLSIPAAGETTAGSHTALVDRNTQRGARLTPSTLWGGTGEVMDLELTIWAICTNHLKHRDVSAETSRDTQ